MHILQVGSYLPPDLVGGGETSAQNLRLVLEAAGHTVSSLRWKQAARFTLGLRIDTLQPGQWAGRTWRPFEPIESTPGLVKAEFYVLEFLTRADTAEIRQFVASNGIDLIILRSFRGFGYDLIDKVCRAGVPVVFVLDDFAMVCMNKGMARKGTLCASRCLQCRYVVFRNRRALGRLGQLAVVAPSRHMLEAVTTALEIDPAHCHHIPNPNAYTAIKRVRDHADPLTLGYVGRLEPDKGVPGLLDCAERLHAACGVKLVVAGQGTLTQTVAAFAATRPWVDFRGQVPSDDVHHVYDAIDVLAIPSLWPENFPGVVVHAMTSGVPCVGFAIGGIPEVIDHGQTGFVVPFGDFAALGDRVLELDRDRALLAALSKGALEACLRYDPTPLARRWTDLIETMAPGEA